jgi:membrane fusion protein (multidrug efflux system)
MNIKFACFTGCLLTLLLLTQCKDKKGQKIQPPSAGGDKSKSMPTKVEGFIVRAGSVGDIIEVPGSLMAYEGTELHPEVSGRVTILNVKEGTTVSKGTLLVKLFDGDLQAQLKKLQVQLAIREKTEQRQAELLKINGISQQEYDLSVLDVSNIKADIELIQTSIAKTELRAPFTGKLGLRNISMGAYVTPQTLITTIREVNQLKLEFSVPEKYASKIKTGSPVLFKLTGNEKVFSARVLATESSVSEDNRSLRVRATVSSRDATLTPGVFAKVRLDFGVNTAAIMVPSQAVIPQARYKNVIVYQQGKAHFAQVQTGARDSSMVEITQGISMGDTIITTGLLSLKPDVSVELTTIKQ